jgi:hypothetical protein
MHEEWLSAADTMSLVEAVLGPHQARLTIARRAHHGLVRTRALRFISDKQSFDNAELPFKFWWAEGQEALEQDWIAGDFSTWINRYEQWRAFGVQFHRGDVLSILPAAKESLPLEEKADVAPSPTQNWVSAREAVVRIMSATGQDGMRSLYSIISYVRTGHIKACAMVIHEKIENRYHEREQEYRNAVVPLWFWEKCTSYDSSALDWQSGVFAGRGYHNGRTMVVRLTGVQFDGDDLEILDPQNQPSRQESNTKGLTPAVTSSNRPKGGRPAAEWWDDLWVEICRQLYLGDLKPKMQSDIERAMLDWLANRGTTAAESTVRGRARKLWDAISAEDEN